MLPPLPRMSELITLLGLSAKQAFSQNFILDLNVTDRIVRAAKLPPASTIFEVGPGPGALTRSLLKAGHSVVAVEKDRRFSPILDELSHATPAFRWHCADALQVDPADLINTASSTAHSPVHVMGNLPFNIGTPLLLKYLHYIGNKESIWRVGNVTPPTLTFIFQKEVAERIAATCNTKAYGRLSIMSQRHCDVQLLFNIANTVYVPAPKVQTTCLQLHPQSLAPWEKEGKGKGEQVPVQVSTQVMEDTLRQGFSQRRKRLDKIFRTRREYLPSEMGSSRPGELSPEQWERIDAALAESEKVRK